MIVALVRKTSVLCWMLAFSGAVISCSVPGHNSLTDSQSQPREGREKTEAAESTVGDLLSQLPSHQMTDASWQWGWIRVELKHGSPSEEHWSEADRDAHSKCQEWGYEEAEVTVTNHYEFSRSSARRYECRGTISPFSEADLDVPAELDVPEDAAEAARTTGELIDEMRAVWASQGDHGLVQAIPVLQRFHAELRSRAEEGDPQAQDMLSGMQHRQAELRSDAEQGDLEALHVLILVSLVVSDEQLQIETWRCFAWSDYDRATALFTLARARGGSKDLIGEVSVAGVTHLAQFQVAGLTRRWDWNCDEETGCRYTFSIEPDSTGRYYDFSISEDGRAKARDVYKCQLSP